MRVREVILPWMWDVYPAVEKWDWENLLMGEVDISLTESGFGSLIPLKTQTKFETENVIV